jgi:hypothetical protein
MTSQARLDSIGGAAPELSSARRLPHTCDRLAGAPLDRYDLMVSDRLVGHIVLALMQPGVSWVEYIHVDSEHRGYGYGVALHELAAMASRTRLLVEHACSPAEARTIASLGRRPGWRVVTVPGLTYAHKGVWALVPLALIPVSEARL